MVDPVPVDDVVTQVDQYDLADDQTVLMDALADGNDLVEPAFHVHRRFGDPGRPDYLGRRLGQSRDLEFVGFSWIFGGGDIHGLGNFVGHNVYHELASLLDVGQSVLLFVPDVPG